MNADEVTRVQRSIARIVRRRVPERFREDAMQDAWVLLCASLPKFDAGRGDIAAFAAVVAKSALWRLHNKHSAKRAGGGAPHLSLEHRSDGGRAFGETCADLNAVDSAVHAQTQIDCASILARSVAHLGRKTTQAIVIELVAKPVDVADRLGCSTWAIQKRRHALVQALLGAHTLKANIRLLDV